MTTLSEPQVVVPRRGFDVASTLRALVRGRAEDVPWARPALLAVTLLAAVLYVWNLAVSGYANTYYSAAALAASQSWSAWFFGSVDAGNFITVDKPPLATMLMGLSVRLFGLSSLSILLPQALLGVGTVALLYHVVRRPFGPAAGIIAAAVMALQPAAVLIFRYNNPDALLTFLLVGAAWALQRGLSDDRRRWLVLAGALVGLGFTTKYLQAYLVLPAFVLAYAVAGAGGLRRRLVGLLVAGVSVLVASGWWVAVVEILPDSMRPYIGGSTNNSVLDLIFGYDGLGRIFGGEGGPGGNPGGGGGGFGGVAGLFRLFNEQFAGQISWLLPLALAALVVGLLVRARAPRLDPGRAAYLVWGGWLVVNVLVFSFMSGIIHSYYVVILAPAIGALIGAATSDLWRVGRRAIVARLLLVVGVVASAWYALTLLDRTGGFAPGVGIAALAAAGAAGVALLAATALGRRQVAVIAGGLLLATVLAGPTAYALDTMQTASSGGDPSAGPSLGVGRGGPGGFAGGGPGGFAPGGTGTFQPPSGIAGTGQAPTGGFGGGFAGGGPGGGGDLDQATLDYLVANRGSATWIVAVDSANRAGSVELSTGLPVMAMGGFSGSDPAPTLKQLQAYVASGQLRFVQVGGQGGGGFGGQGSASSVSGWVTTACTPVDTGSGTSSSLYDCAGAVTSGG